MSILILVTLITLVVLIRRYFNASRALDLPPGPKKHPLIGNLLVMPKKNEWETYHRWCKEYGMSHYRLRNEESSHAAQADTDIIHLDVAGSSIVVLDTPEVAMELLDKRSSIYSDR